MSCKGKSVLILGATGVVGSGAAINFLKQGATVVVVSRTDAKLQELIKSLSSYGTKEQLLGVVGTFATKAEVEACYAKVKAALKGASPDHVVSSLGFAAVTPTGVLDSDLKVFTDSMDESFYPTFLSAQVILKDIKEKEGTSYTIVSGGFAHGCFFPGCWGATLKNGATNNLIACLATDTASSKVRVNGNCLHYSVAPKGAEANQLGMPTAQSNDDFGKTFIGFATKTDLKGKLVCFDKKEDAEKF